MKNRLVISIIVLVSLATLAVVFFVFLWPRFNQAREENETTAAGTAAATKAPYVATTKTKAANEVPATTSIYDIGEARFTVTIKQPNFSDGVEPPPEVQVYTNPEVGTVVVDGLFRYSEWAWDDGNGGEHREKITTPGSISITGVTDTFIELLVLYEDEEEHTAYGEENEEGKRPFHKLGKGRMEQKLKVEVGKELPYYTNEGLSIIFNYDYDMIDFYEERLEK